MYKLIIFHLCVILLIRVFSSLVLPKYNLEKNVTMIKRYFDTHQVITPPFLLPAHVLNTCYRETPDTAPGKLFSNNYGDDPEEHVEYAHDGTELHCVVQGPEYANIHNVFTISNYCIWLPDWEPCGENDNVK